MPFYSNNDGLEVRFGNDIGSRRSKAAVTTGAGKRRELVLLVDLVALGAAGTGYTADLNNDGVFEAFNPSNTPLPAGSRILGFNEITITAPAGGTSYEIGTYLENGTVDQVAGIRTSVGAAGAQVGTVIAAERFVAAKSVGTYTAGKIKVIIEFMTV